MFQYVLVVAMCAMVPADKSNKRMLPVKRTEAPPNDINSKFLEV